MGRIWAIARQTIAESLRMKIALVFIAFILVLVVGLPFALRKEDSVSSAVQTFLSFSIGGVEFFLSLLAIFLSRSLSEEVAGGQILTLMAKPIPRWQFVVGKWLGIVVLVGALLGTSGAAIYGTARWMATRPPRDEFDQLRLRDEILTARHAVPITPIDFSETAERLFNERLESGAYEDVIEKLDKKKEKARLRKDAEQRYRTLFPLESRVFDFENVRCDRSPDRTIQLRYKAEVWAYPMDEVLRAEWFVGNPDLGTPLYQLQRRDVINRYHSLFVPANAVAPDRSLRAQLYNRNPFEGEPQYGNTISFTSFGDIEVLFTVGTFGGNLARQLTMVMCKLVLLAAFAVMTVCVFSFPVACLVSFAFLALATMSGFLNDSLIHFEDEGVYWAFKKFAELLYTVAFFVIPDFSKYDGTSMLVNGRNVTLRWVLTAISNLGLGTIGIGLAACLMFQRREVAETSF